MPSDSISRLLYNYLLQKGEMSVPGFGGFRINRLSAKNDFAAKQVLPPTRTLLFDHSFQQPSDHQLNFLVGKTGKPFNQLLDQLKVWGKRLSERVQANGTVVWPELGEFSIDERGSLHFTSVATFNGFDTAVGYTHVLREQHQHTIKVGEDERTSNEMESYFEEQKQRATYFNWQAFSVFLLILMTVLLGYRFTLGSHDLKTHRYNPISPSISTPLYERIP